MKKKLTPSRLRKPIQHIPYLVGRRGTRSACYPTRHLRFVVGGSKKYLVKKPIIKIYFEVRLSTHLGRVVERGGEDYEENVQQYKKTVLLHGPNIIRRWDVMQPERLPHLSSASKVQNYKTNEVNEMGITERTLPEGKIRFSRVRSVLKGYVLKK